MEDSVTTGAKNFSERGPTVQVNSPADNQVGRGDQPASGLHHKKAATTMPPMRVFTPPRRIDAHRAALVLEHSSPLLENPMSYRLQPTPRTVGLAGARRSQTRGEEPLSPLTASVLPEPKKHTRGAKFQTTATATFVGNHAHPQIRRDPGPSTAAPAGAFIPPYVHAAMQHRSNLPGTLPTATVDDYRLLELRPTKVRPVELLMPRGQVTVPFYYAFLPKEAGFDSAIKFPHIPCDLFGTVADNIIPSFFRPATYEEAQALGWIHASATQVQDLDTGMPTMAGTRSHIRANSRGPSLDGLRIRNEGESRKSRKLAKRPRDRADKKQNASEYNATERSDGEDRPRKKPRLSKGISKKTTQISSDSTGSESLGPVTEQSRRRSRRLVRAPSPRFHQQTVWEMNKEILQDIMATIPDI
ncbi:hypothetical protein DV737_g3510, partial [Chaetothyriales sp. CBS 132003]